MTKIISTKMPRSHAEAVALSTLDTVRGFAHNLYEKRPDFHLNTAIMELDVLDQRLRGLSSPLRNQLEVDEHFAVVTQEIVNFSPAISTQLNEFWDAHLEIASLAESSDNAYGIMKYADDNQKKILDIDKRYTNVTNRVNKDPNDEITIYGLFYLHILKTEVIEYAYIEQFKELLRDFNLSKRYDAEEIFSATSKISKGKVWKTEARAMRDCITHNKYELQIDDSSWNILFDNQEDGYNYVKTFSRNEFLQFENETDLLYRSTLMLILRIISGTLIKQHLLQK